MPARNSKPPSKAATRGHKIGPDSSDPGPASKHALLGPQLGTGVGSDAEAGGGLLNLLKDPQLRTMAVELWRNFQLGSAGAKRAHAEGEGAPADLWDFQAAESVTTSSSAEEIERYRTKLLFRADWLEATLEATLNEVERLSQFRPAAEAPVVEARPQTPARRARANATKKRSGKPDQLPTMDEP